MADELVKINSKYDMIEIMRNIASAYFPSDISENRLGMFGFITESMANMFGASILDASIRSYEYNILTAKQFKTLMKEAAIYKVDIATAKPATIDMIISVPIKHIIAKPYEGGFGTITSINPDGKNNYKLVLEKDTTITLYDYTFMFEYDIEISANWSQDAGKYIYTVRYLTEGDTDQTSLIPNYVYPAANVEYPIKNKYIQSVVSNNTTATDESFKDVLTFSIPVCQMKKQSTYYNVIKNDIVALSHIECVYDNSLAYFNVYYQRPGSKEWTFIKAVSSYDIATYNEQIVKYDLDITDNKLVISISDFSPEYGSKFRVDIYSTIGEDANELRYTGVQDTVDNDVIVTLNSLDDRHNYVGMYLAALPSGETKGGKNAPSMEEIRQKLVIAKSSANSLTTEYDLLNYIKTKDLVSSFAFIKKRSDIYNRIYGAYSILRNASSEIMGTSTLPYSKVFGVSDIGNDGQNEQVMLIKAGSPLISLRYVPDAKITGNQTLDAVNKYYEDSRTAVAGSNIFMDNNETKNFSTFDAKEVLTDLDVREPYVQKIGATEQVKYKYSDKPFDDSHYTIYPPVSLEKIIDEDGADVKLLTTINSELIEQNTDTNKIFASPYTIIYNAKNGIVSTFITSINQDIYMNIFNEESFKLHAIIGDILLTRDAYSETTSKYKISIPLILDGDATIINAAMSRTIEGTEKPTPQQLLNDILMLRLYIHDDSKAIKAWINLSLSDYANNIFTFSGEIDVDDILSGDGKYIKSLNTYDIDTGAVLSDFIIKIFGFYFSVGVYYLNIDNSDTGIPISSLSTDPPAPVMNNDVVEKEEVGGTGIEYPKFSKAYTLNNVTKNETYTLINIYDTNNTEINLYKDMSSVIDISVEEFAYDGQPNLEYYGFTKTDDGWIINTAFPDQVSIPNFLNAGDVINIEFELTGDAVVTINGVEYSSSGADLPNTTLSDPISILCGTTSLGGEVLIKSLNVTNAVKKYILYIPELPVSQCSELRDEEYSLYTVNMISEIRDTLLEMNDYIENNFGFDYKFFRTYGHGRYFMLCTSTGLKNFNSDGSVPGDNEAIPLGDLNIKLEMNAMIKTGVALSDGEIQNQLKAYIKDKIESMNEYNSNYTVYLSNIITDIEQQFSTFLQSIELVGINGNDSQYRILYYNMPAEISNGTEYNTNSRENIQTYIPEFINVPADNITINVLRPRWR